MKRIAIVTMLATSVATAAVAQKMPAKTSSQIVADEEIISSGPVDTSSASRTHEAFVMFKGGLYYCLLTGAAETDHTPCAECYGPPITRD